MSDVCQKQSTSTMHVAEWTSTPSAFNDGLGGRVFRLCGKTKPWFSIKRNPLFQIIRSSITLKGVITGIAGI